MLNRHSHESQVIRRIANAILASIMALFRGHFSLAQVNFKQKLYLGIDSTFTHYTPCCICHAMPPQEMKTN